MFSFGKNYRVCVQWAYCGPESALYNSRRPGSADACARSVNHLMESKPPRITAHFDKRFKNVRAGLGVVNLNFYDYRRETNYVTLQTNGNGNGYTKLHINYEPAEHEDDGGA